MSAEAQTLYRTPFASVIKAAPAQLVLGALNDALPAAYANTGLYVTVQQSGWQSLDGKTFRVSAVTPGTSSNAPGITLEGSDVTLETGGNIPRTDAFVEIRQTPNNFARFTPPSGAPLPTNLITNQNINSAYWGPTGLTFPANNQMMETAANSAHFMLAVAGTGFPALTGAHSYFLSVDVTPVGGGRYLALYLNSFASEIAAVQVDLQLGTVLGVTGTGWVGFTGNLSLLGGGTWRVSLTVPATAPSTTGLVYNVYMLSGLNGFAYAGNTANGMIVTNITFYKTG